MTGVDPLPAVLAKSPTRRNPTGETLTTHLEATLHAANILARRVGTLACLPQAMASRFWRLAAWAALTHDAGKIAAGFQHMLTHSDARWPNRHEVLSLGFLTHLLEPGDLAWVAVPVATHHRPLFGDGAKVSLQQRYIRLDPARLHEELGHIPAADATALVDWLRSTAARHHLPLCPDPGTVTPQALVADAHRILHQILREWRDADPVDGLAAVLLQGALTASDHISSAVSSVHAHLHTRQPLDHTYPPALRARLTGKGHALFPHQEHAARTSTHMILTAATGFGKTEAALLWSTTNIEHIRSSTQGEPRVFYVLPYLASINAMATRLSSEIGSPDLVGVSHSRAASHHLGASLADRDDIGDTTRIWAARKAVGRAHATRLFRELVRVGTPYQLLRAALAGPVHSGILLDSASSVFILDELHAYDPKRLGFILAAARMWEQLGGRIAVLSATLPTALACLLADTLHTPISTVRATTQSRPRHILHASHETLTDAATLARISEKVSSGQAVLVVANNVRDAIDLYDQLCPEVEARWGAGSAHLLHSRFKRCDRDEIEKTLLRRWKTGTPHHPGLLVATQCVEVSLDLDFDALHTSAAPLEALLQRFGRVNRVGARPPATVTVHAPTWRTRNNALFADGVYDHGAVDPAWTIIRSHDGTPVDDDTTQTWLDAVYATPWGQQWRTDVTIQQRRFATSFLTFDDPFTDRSELEDLFDEMFDGTEAILQADEAEYGRRLSTAPDAAGKLWADDLLVPLPWYGGRLGTWSKALGVRVIDGDYTSRSGLRAIHHRGAHLYQPGEII